LIRSGDGALVTIGAKKSQALLAYLAMKPAQHVSREKLAGLLWSSTGPDQARQSLRQTLSDDPQGVVADRAEAEDLDRGRGPAFPRPVGVVATCPSSNR